MFKVENMAKKERPLMIGLIAKLEQKMRSLWLALAIGQIILYPLQALAQKYDPFLEESQDQCKSPMKWDKKSSRCIVPNDIRATREGAKEFAQRCDALEDQKERKACYENFAKASAQCDGIKDMVAKRDCYARESHSFDFNKDANDLGGVGDAADWLNKYGIVPINLTMLIIALVGMTGTGGKCFSRTVFSATAAASFLAEVYHYFFTEDELQTLLSNYEKEAVKESSQEAQGRALEYMRDQLQTVADIHGKKFIVYTILSIGFGVAATMAWLETGSVMSACSPLKVSALEQDKVESKWPAFYQAQAFFALGNDLTDDLFLYQEWSDYQQGEKLQSPTLADYQKAKVFEESYTPSERQIFKSLLQMSSEFLISKAHADVYDFITGGVISDTAFGKSKMFKEIIGAASILALSSVASLAAPIKKIFQMLNSSPGIGVISTVSAGFNVILAAASKSAQNEAQDQKSMVDRLIREFKSAVQGTCSPADREDLYKPHCYCEDESGSPTHPRSETCQKYRAEADGIKLPKIVDAPPGSKELTCCVTQTGQADCDCKCKRFHDKRGKNLCRTVPAAPTQVGSLGNALGVGDAMDRINEFNSGERGTAKYNQGALGQQAAKISRANRQLLDKVNQKRLQQGLSSINPKSVMEQFLNNVDKKALEQYQAKNNNLAKFQNTLPKGINKEELAKISKKVGPKVAAYMPASQAASKKSAQTPQGFNLSGDNGGGNNQLDFKDKNYDYGENDIVKNDDSSIWQVISNRYTQSGLRRLFDDSRPVLNEKAAP